MDSRSLKLNEFITEYPLWGEWEVFYTDGTHLPEDEYVKLGDIIVDAYEEIALRYPILPFTFWPVTDEKLKVISLGYPKTKARPKRIEHKKLYMIN